MKTNIAISELDARLVMHGRQGNKVRAILMECPLASCAHWIVIPFDTKIEKLSRGEIVWRLTSSSDGLDTITLAPSYRLVGSCGLHGFVRLGHWVNCSDSGSLK